MRLVCLSDTHTFEDQIDVPDGDVLIHAGDATINGEYSEVSCFMDWFGTLPHKHKILVAGNHDWLFERSPDEAKELVAYDEVHYLQDSSVTIDGVHFYGSPWQPRFQDWAFNVDRGEAIKQKWNLIPQCDVLITHGPPWGVLDKAVQWQGNLGCEELLKALARIQPKVHIFGHIHGSHGQVELTGTRFVNAAICDEAYRAVNKPIVIDL